MGGGLACGLRLLRMWEAASCLFFGEDDEAKGYRPNPEIRRRCAWILKHTVNCNWRV
jgi:hypothetical protein